MIRFLIKLTKLSFWLGLSFIFLVNCYTRKIDNRNSLIEQKSEDSQVITEDIDQKRNAASGISATKTYHVKEKMVLFLRLTDEEYKNYSQDIQYEIVELLSDFYAYVNRVAEILEKNGIQHDITSDKKIIFHYPNGDKEELFFDTSEYLVAFALFNKKKKPEMHYGIVLADEILEKVSEYFEIDLKK